MKTKKRIVQYMAGACMLALCITTIAGCKPKQQGEPGTAQPEQTASPEPGSTGLENENNNTEQPQPTTSSPADPSGTEEMLELPIYTVDSDTLEKMATVARIPKPDKLTAEIVLDTVVEAFHEIGTSIGIDSVTEENDSVTVSFTKDKAPYYNTGSTMESAILDCIAQSLMDNLEECKKVFYRLEGKMYESGHFIFELDEPYMTK